MLIFSDEDRDSVRRWPHRWKRKPGRGSRSDRGHDAPSLENQLARAAEVQRSLLPDLTEPMEGFRIACAYRPCESLAGDFYDICRDRDEATLIVADVMGHGAEAALLTMLVKAVFHEMAPVIRDIGTLLWGMDAHLRRLIPEGFFVATTVLRIERGTPEVKLSNAGMPYPVVLRSRTRRVEDVPSKGMPLGLELEKPPGAYQKLCLELQPGDVLLIRSDGIGSIESRSGESFGDTGVRQAVDRLPGLPVERVVEVLLEEALRHGSGCGFGDDVNLVALSRVCPDAAPDGCGPSG